MAKLFKVWHALFFVCNIFSAYSFTETKNGYVVYSSQEMLDHKKQWQESIVANPLTYSDHTYQLTRTLLTITAHDADYIPKVVGAGEIFKDAIVPYQLMHNGIKVVLHCYYDDHWMADVIYGLKGHHEPQEEKCFYEVLKYMPEGATMIELGSYWAYYSLWFASEVKNAKNYMIEPDERRLEVGRKNFELNNKTGYFKRGYAGFVTEEGGKESEYISIDDFIDQQGINHVNILHADIQGAEMEMLKTTVKHLDRIDYLFISTHSAKLHRQCLRFVAAHNFDVIADHCVSESCSADGLVVAKRKGVAGPDHIEVQTYNPPRNFWS